MTAQQELREKCGVFGIAGDVDVTELTYYGLYALQHRGQESAGIAVADGERVTTHKAMGLVADVFAPADLKRLREQAGFLAIGHTRYSTSGGSLAVNAQPISVRYHSGDLAIGHNGNLVNADTVRQRMESKGSIFQTTVDTEVMAHLIALYSTDYPFEDSVVRALEEVRGAFGLVMLTGDTLVAARDPAGIRPLSIGRLERGLVVASETCALDTVGAEYVRDVAPGEVLFLRRDGLASRYLKGRSRPTPAGLGSVRAPWLEGDQDPARDVDQEEQPQANGVHNLGRVHTGKSEAYGVTTAGPSQSLDGASSKPPALCVFEYVYLSRPDSNLEGRNVHLVRKQSGRLLAQDAPVDADLVTGVPQSSLSAASGYAEELGIPYEMGLIKNRYVGRTFIQPSQEQRELGVKLKLNPIRKVVEGKRVVLVDDSIVRGTTSRQLVTLLRRAGATEVHLRIASPPFRHPCFYGIDVPDRDQLVAAGRTEEDICELTGADSLAYLGIERLVEAVGAALGTEGFCHACFSGRYPVPVPAGSEVGV